MRRRSRRSLTSSPATFSFCAIGTLVAQPFDAKTLKTTGEPIPLAEQVGTDTVGLARFSVSREGTLAYRTGEMTDRLVWVDRSGKELETEGDPSRYGDPHLSSDGRRLAFDVVDARTGKTDIWIRDLNRRVSSRFSFSQARRRRADVLARRQPDRLRRRQRPGRANRRRAGSRDDRSGNSTGVTFVTDWSADGQSIAFSSQGKGTAFDIWIMPASGDRKPHPWLQTPFSELNAVFSPDGRYLAYQSNESGTPGDLRAVLPGPGRQVAGFLERRKPAALARRRQASSSIDSRSEDHGGRRDDGRDVRSRRAEGALLRSPRHHPGARRTLVSRRRTASASCWWRTSPRATRDPDSTTVVLDWFAADSVESVTMTSRHAGTRSSVPTKSSRRSARAAWARCTGARHAPRPRRRDQGAAAASRRSIGGAARALRARGEDRSRRSTIRTSARSSTSAARATPTTS